MNKLKVITFLILLFIGESLHAKKTSGEISCDTHTTILTVYTKNDSNIISRSCESKENQYIENYFIYQNQKIIVNKYSIDGGKSPQELAAVSI